MGNMTIRYGASFQTNSQKKILITRFKDNYILFPVHIKTIILTKKSKITLS